jgi:hypothetical protein
MEHRLHPRLEHQLDHRLRDAVAHGGHAQHPRPRPMRLGDFHRAYRWREVGPRREPVPNLVQVVLHILLELGNRHLVDPGRTLVGRHPLVGLPHEHLVDVEGFALRLWFTHPTPPNTVG